MTSITTTGTASARPATSRAGQSPAFAALWWGTILAALLCLAALAVSAHVVPYFPADLSVARAVQSVPAAWFHSLMIAVSWPGFPPQVYVLVVVIGVAFYAGHQKRQALYFVVATVGVATVSQGVKILVDRPRPSPSLIHNLNPALNGGHWSFPAGHVESYVVIFGFIGFLAYREWRASIWRSLVLLLSVLMVVLIGVSRIDSGEHWFSDVMGGYLLGLVWLAGTVYFYQRGQRRAAGARTSRVEVT